MIRAAYREKFYRYGWDGTYAEAIKYGYGRSLSGMVYAARRMGICMADSKAKPPRKHDRRYPELLRPGREGADRREGSAVLLLKRGSEARQ